VVAYYVLYCNTFGRSVYAVGGNAVSSWLSGINVKHVQFLAYIVSAFLAALCALASTGRVGQTSISTLADLALGSVAAATVGGISLAGARGNLYSQKIARILA
jgi:ribose/xylose/arabinose/galactoside ABC-type transport system permease subunit